MIDTSTALSYKVPLRFPLPVGPWVDVWKFCAACVADPTSKSTSDARSAVLSRLEALDIVGGLDCMALKLQLEECY
jgi:hypothetical protein